MMPLKVSFTDLDIDPLNLLISNRLQNGVIPADWIRIQFNVEKFTQLYLFEKWVNSWLKDVSDDKWTFYSRVEKGDQTVVVAFESINDAMMFKLKDGETAWNYIFD